MKKKSPKTPVPPQNESAQTVPSIEALQLRIDDLEQNLATRGREIDLLQINAGKPRSWWKNPSNIISILAVSLSIFATTFSVRDNFIKQENQTRQRVKDIVKRMTEIQTRFINGGDKLAVLQQMAMPELTNLLDEAVKIAKKNPKFLNDSEYATIINMAFQTNKTEGIEQLIENGLSVADDITTEYSLLNLHMLNINSTS